MKTLLYCLGLLLFAMPVVAQQTSSRVAAPLNVSAFVSAFPDSWTNRVQTEKAQKQVFVVLVEKTGHAVALPDYPPDALIRWALKNFKKAGSNSKALYASVYEQLLVAQKLAEAKDVRQQRRALRLAHNANFKVAVRLKDKKLCARIFEGFILPYLSAAPVGKGTLSQARLLQDAASAFRLVGERDKQSQVLKALISVAEKDKDSDGADWARVKLADVLAAQGLYSQAVEQLKAVTAPNMSGAKRRIPALQAKVTAENGKLTPEKTEK